MTQKKRKKLVGGLKYCFQVKIFIIIFFCKTINAYQIYDFQTDKFVDKLISEILSVNNYNKKINYKIINFNFPNAFVSADNTIHITSGLIINSPDYVSLLAVLAHEIGHIEKYHIKKRKNEINELKKLNSIGNIAAIAGSMIIQDPQIINSIILNQTAITNLFLDFSQEQEREADIYAVETLNKLMLPKDSLFKLLQIIEYKSQSDIFDEELKKFSTHPLFEERYEILNLKESIHKSDFNKNLQNEFNFIQAKFMAYTNTPHMDNLNIDEKIYYEAISSSLSGKLLESLKKLNSLIHKYENNTFLIETKADILLSYGYNKQAIDFYKKTLDKNPENYYAKFNIFLNSTFNKKEKDIINEIFYDNIHLIKLYPYNKSLLIKFNDLAKILELTNWNTFFEILLLSKNETKSKLLQLDMKTKDNNLKKLIKMYI